MDKNNEIEKLLDDYLHNRIDKPSFERLMSLVEELGPQALNNVFQKMDSGADDDMLDDTIRENVSRIRQSINRQLDEVEIYEGEPVSYKSRTKRLLWTALSTAAVIVLAIAFSLYFFKFRTITRDTAVAESINAIVDVLPGGNKAEIIVGGRTMVLDTTKDGIHILDGMLSYADGTKLLHAGQDNDSPITIRTPKGGQYHVILPDGTKVWINSGSELSFKPFSGQKQRQVNLEGEAYFEVTKDPNAPFVVQFNKERVMVLGTKFNISAYADDKRSVSTLVEGKIQFETADKKQILSPNQQMVFEKEEGRMKLKTVDVSPFLGWKDGIFDFNGHDFAENMEIIARWYAVDIKYEGHIPQVDLGGKMSRGVRLSTFLNYLKENFGVHTELKDTKTLIIK